MDDGIFSAAVARAVRPLPTLVPRCDRCGLHRHPDLEHPKMRPTGEGRRRILLVSDYPGPDEDREGRQFAGGTGRFLEEVLRELGCSMRRDLWLTNALICHDAAKKHPKTAINDCRPNLLRTLDELKPLAVVVAGSAAAASLLGHLWKADVGKVGRWVGYQIPAHTNYWVCPTYNPAHLLRDGGRKDPVLQGTFRDHLRAALALTERPWPDGPPRLERAVETVLDPDTAAARIRGYRTGTVAFDFETTTLKPDGPAARIVCCSVCWEGRETIAFPWMGDARAAVCELLEDPDVGKIGANIKFETRWAFRKLGVRVRGWVWDCMLAAHLLDPRRGVTGLKFQSFVRLGQPDYNHHIEPFLDAGKEAGGNAANRIHEVSTPLLLKYCGQDSLLEYQVARHQMKEMGVDDA